MPVNLIPRFIHDQYQAGCRSGQFTAVAMFVDISGFTAMTEILLQHGKNGAEILANTMRCVFDPLLDRVAAHGGQVMGFAGDAFTALFPYSVTNSPGRTCDQDKACRWALQTASGVQHHFQNNPVQATPVGDFTFAVKIGLAEGEVKWGILGDVSANGRCTWYLRGPAIDACAAAENLAERGEIVVTKSLFQRCSPMIQGMARGDSGYCLTAGTGQIEPCPPAPVWQGDPDIFRVFFPPEIVQLSTVGEFRQVLTVFLSLGQIDESHDLERLNTLVAQLIRTYGGFMPRFDFGDKGCYALLFWGAAVHFENDPERALNFLLDFKSALASGDLNISFRAGVTYQMMYVGYAGGTHQGEFSGYGRGINLAARMAMFADWGEILLDRNVVKAAWTQFDISLKDMVAFKGFSREIPVSVLHDRAQLGITISYEGELVGRDGELNRLFDFLEPCWRTNTGTERFAGTAIVYGEAGMGKSRLVYELRRQVLKQRPAWWFFCPCDEILRESLNPFKYFLFRFFQQSRINTAAENQQSFEDRFEQLRDELQAVPADQTGTFFVDDLDQVVDPIHDVLAEVLGLKPRTSILSDLNPESRFQSILFAFKNLFKILSLLRPVIISIDDIQWLDPESQKLIENLVKNIKTVPLAIVATSRYTDRGSKPALIGPASLQFPHLSLELDSLTTEGVHHLADNIINQPIDPGLSQFIAQKSQGNPYFAEQLTFELREKGLIETTDGVACLNLADDTVIPTRIRDVLISRLDRLPWSVKQVIQTAAVLGVEFELPVLEQLLATDQSIAEEVAIAARAAVWSSKSDIAYIFRHALMRDAAYDMQLPSRLQQIHEQAGQIIEKHYAASLEPHYGTLAYHFERAGHRDKMNTYLLQAGVQAMHEYQNQAALGYFEKLLNRLDDQELARRIEVHYLIGEIKIDCGLWTDAEDHITTGRQLAQNVTDPALVGNGWRKLGRLWHEYGESQKAFNAWQTALDIFNSQDDEESLMRVQLDIGHYHTRQGNYQEALDIFQKYLDWVQARKMTVDTTPVLMWIGNVLLQQNKLDLAREKYEEALAQIEANQHRESLGTIWANLGLTLLMLGEYEEAQRYLEQSLSACLPTGKLNLIGFAYRNLGYVTAFRGDLATARKYHEQQLAIALELGSKHSLGHAYHALAELSFKDRDYPRAIKHGRQSLCLAQEIGEKELLEVNLITMGQIYLAQGRVGEAEPMFQQALELGHEMDDSRGVYDGLGGLAECAQAKDEFIKAIEYYDQIIDLTEKDPIRPKLEYYLYRKAEVLRHLHHWEEALEYIARSQAISRYKPDQQFFQEAEKLRLEIMQELGRES